MDIPSPIGPIIPPSILHNSNETTLEKVVEELFFTTLTDGVATISGSTISNLVDPTADSDAATKNYILTNGPFVPAGSDTEVQFRGTTTFDSDSTFTFDKTTNTLSVPTITDGIATLNAGLLSDILDPVSAQDAATKNYMDNTKIITQSMLTSSIAMTYTATQMYNGFIKRGGFVFSTPIITDTTATAAQLIAEFPSAQINSTAYFAIYFSIDDDTTFNAMSIIGGTGVTIEPLNPILYGNYIAVGKIIVDNITGGSEAVTLHFDSISYFTDVNWTSVSSDPGWSILTRSIGSGKQALEITEADVSEEFLTPMSPITLTDQNHNYTFNEISNNKLIARGGLSANSVDSFVSAESFISSGDILTLSGGISNSNLSGLEFLIQNIDPTFSITLTGATGWTLNGDLTIGPGQNGLFIVQVDTVVNECTLFSLGIFNRNG